MTKKQQIELAFAKKKYDVIPTEEMAKKVSELDKLIEQPLNIFSDEDTYEKYAQLRKLNLSDRRLILVYSILDGSIAKTASYFNVNRKTILNNLNRIKEELLK